MIIITCDACLRRIAEDDRAALRGLPMYDESTGERLPAADYCGPCVRIIRAELPRLATEARTLRQWLSVARPRAGNLWAGLAERVDSTPTVE